MTQKKSFVSMMWSHTKYVCTDWTFFFVFIIVAFGRKDTMERKKSMHRSNCHHLLNQQPHFKEIILLLLRNINNEINHFIHKIKEVMAITTNNSHNEIIRIVTDRIRVATIHNNNSSSIRIDTIIIPTTNSDQWDGFIVCYDRCYRTIVFSLFLNKIIG